MLLKFKNLISNFINSGWSFTQTERLEQLRYQIINLTLIFSLFIIPIGMVYNYFIQNYTLIILESFLMLFMIFSLFLLRKSRSTYLKTINILTIGTILFFDSLIAFSHPEDLKFTWILFYASVFVFYKGDNKAYVWILVFCFSVILLKLQSFHPILFSWTQISYFFLVLFSLVGAISFFKYVIENNLKTILIQKQELERFNLELEEKIQKEVAKAQEKDKIYFQQAKMAAMGEMLANIAHQWRQPLQTINIVAGGMKVHKNIGTLDEKMFEENIQSIENTVDYLSQTITDFKDFFKTDQHPEFFNIAYSLEHDIRLVKPSLKGLNINIISNFKNIEIHSYQNQLSQVILNVLNNAKDALIHCDEQEKYIFISTLTTDDEVIISIKDNAGGIDKEIITNIFDPYFTTKHKSQGTGIGLFMAQEIITVHLKGTIQVTNTQYTYQNKSYKGAQFDIHLKKDTVF